MLRKIISGLVLCGFVFTGIVALAQAPAVGRGEAPNVTFRKKTVYDFDDDIVEGELMRPDGEFIDTNKKAMHLSLIKIRQNFIPEMLKSAEDI